MPTITLKPFSVFAIALLGLLSICSLGNSQVFEGSLSINSQYEYGLGQVASIQSDGEESPTIVVVVNGRIAAPSGITVSDESTLILDGGSLANSLHIEDNATFIYRSGEIACNAIAGGCGFNPLLNPLVFATENASLEIYSDNLVDDGYFDLRDDSIAKIYGVGLVATVQSTPGIDISIVTIEGTLPQEVIRVPLTLRLRNNASFELIEVPEPGTLIASLLLIATATLFSPTCGIRS